MTETPGNKVLLKKMHPAGQSVWFAPCAMTIPVAFLLQQVI